MCKQAGKLDALKGLLGRAGHEGMDIAKLLTGGTMAAAGGAGGAALGAVGAGMGHEDSEGYLDNLGAMTGGGIAGGATMLPAALLIEKLLQRKFKFKGDTRQLLGKGGAGIAGLLGGAGAGVGVGGAVRDSLYG